MHHLHPVRGSSAKRILFVDDEPSVLRAYGRALRPLRGDWTVETAESGERALERLAEQHYDVVISDMRMPGMDGAQLLTRISSSHPDCVRILFSGHSELEPTMRAAPFAHRFVLKPASPLRLCEMIGRTLDLGGLLRDETLRKLAGSTTQLPARPEVYARLCHAMADRHSSLETIAKIVERDVGLTAKLLQLVNTPYFGIARRVTSVLHAVSYLGLGAVRGIAASFETIRALGVVPHTDMDMIQERNFLAARLAASMFTKATERDDAFAAAMLSEIGLLLMAAKRPALLAETAIEARDNEESLLAVQQGRWGVTHLEVGAYLLSLWGLPTEVVEAVAHCHMPARVQHQGFALVDAVHVAACLAEYAHPNSGSGFVLDEDHLASLGVMEKLPQWKKLAEDWGGHSND